jgi:hypothetical protein
MRHFLRTGIETPCRLAIVAVCLACLAATAGAQARPSTTPASPAPRTSRGEDSAFSAVQARGADARGMGVDQYTSAHEFDALADGGRIELQRAVDDSAGVAQIRRHLREIAAAFGAGDFRTPGFVHMQQVPGTAVMAAKRAAISYAERDLPRGGEVRITTHDPEALAAVHAFIAFQRQEHHAGGAGTPKPMDHGHGGHSHPH